MYQPTIGLEIHVELKTKTKMFCGCLNNPDEKQSNKNICPICLAHPGTLPVANKKAVEAVLKLGLALDSEIPEMSKFDRKNYFYPDLPKGYQISQYDKPLVFRGELNGIKLRRIHLEEDTGSLIHPTGKNYSLIDFNRAGVPLMELVTEPDIESGEQAVKFAKELQLILRYLDISDADMEKGQMRVEANISLTNDQQPTTNDNKLGTKAEVKNLNSFRAVGEAIDYEIKRQTEILESGKKVVHETRGWDEIKKKTEHQRIKEESHDYRYFPEPDLPPLDISGFDMERLKAEIPELPAEKRERFKKEYDLKPEQAEILVQDRDLSKYFEESASELKSELPSANWRTDCQLLFNYLSSDLNGLMNERGIVIKDLKITPENFADLIVLIAKEEISSRVAKDVLRKMNITGLDPREIVKEGGLEQISDEEEIKKVVVEIIGKNQKAAEDYKKGKEAVLQFLIGQAMAKLKGRGNPEILKKIFKEII